MKLLFGVKRLLRCPEIVTSVLHKSHEVDPSAAILYTTLCSARRVLGHSQALQIKFIEVLKLLDDTPLGRAPGPVAGMRRAADALGLKIRTDEEMNIYLEGPCTQGRLYLIGGNDRGWKDEVRRICQRSILHNLAQRDNHPKDPNPPSGSKA